MGATAHSVIRRQAAAVKGGLRSACLLSSRWYQPLVSPQPTIQ